VLVSSHLTRPENFHEIAGLGPIETVEVLAEAQFMEQTRGARPIRVPSAPDAFAIVLIANDQTLKGAVVEPKLPAFAQRFDRSDEHQIRRARAETRPRRDNKKFPGFKVGRRLETNLCKMRNRVTTALRHLIDLIENQVVVISGERELWRDSNKRRDDAYIELVHRRISKHRNMIWQRHARNN